MSSASQVTLTPSEHLESGRSRIVDIRERARRLFEGGATGVQVAASISEAIDAFVVELIEHAIFECPASQRAAFEEHSAVIAVGGSGRGELAPHSDADLMFLYDKRAARIFPAFAAQMVRDCWDAGIKLGHSVRTVGESISMARRDPQVATALLEAQRLWGSANLFERFKRRFGRRVVFSRKRTFVEACIAARSWERAQHNATVQQLEPDIKRSLGGLRDVHLIRWIGFAEYGTNEIDSLRLKGALSKDDARALVAAHEFLTRVRIDLHFAAGRAQDTLSRQEQLRIAAQRGIADASGQRPVERFMQEYFRHSMAIANIAGRFAALHRPEPIGWRLVRFAATRRVNRIYKLGPETIDVAGRHRRFVCESLERVLRLYHAAVLYGVAVSTAVEDEIKSCLRTLRQDLTAVDRELFLKIVGCSGRLGATLRSMYNTGLLDVLLPEMGHARCLLQFNEYHSYTVDEHTLRAIEAIETFERDEGRLGTAYRSIHRKDILHLAVLLHDLGKGYPGDHSDVGREIAERTAARLNLSDDNRETLVFLVHKHLLMAHLAFRRNIADPKVLIPFSREVGSPETLQMLYVLTAADLMAVGPDVWTQWKADLLTEMYDRAMLVLSGKRYDQHEADRLARTKQAVRNSIVPLDDGTGDATDQRWLDSQLDALPPHYLSDNPVARIAADLAIVRGLKPCEVVVEGRWENETGTVDYRIVAHRELAEGCFHKVAGVLTAMRLEILSAQICTNADGTVIDSFRVLDEDYPGEVPQFRIDEIRNAIEAVLGGGAAVPELFLKHKRFAGGRRGKPISELPTRVVIDNDSSDYCTIIDVFAHDRPGLLYTISLALYGLGFSVLLAKIATHFDQVVDVFYVTDNQERKISDKERLRNVQAELAARLEEFEHDGHLTFIR